MQKRLISKLFIFVVVWTVAGLSSCSFSHKTASCSTYKRMLMVESSNVLPLKADKTVCFDTLHTTKKENQRVSRIAQSGHHQNKMVLKKITPSQIRITNTGKEIMKITVRQKSIRKINEAEGNGGGPWYMLGSFIAGGIGLYLYIAAIVASTGTGLSVLLLLSAAILFIIGLSRKDENGETHVLAGVLLGIFAIAMIFLGALNPGSGLAMLGAVSIIIALILFIIGLVKAFSKS